MKLYKRDYLKGLNDKEKIEYKQILQQETEGRTFGHKNLFYKYPSAARNWMSLFPNNYLDIIDLKNRDKLSVKNTEFKNLIETDTTRERDVLNFINQNENYHIIGSILKGAGYRFGHHSAYLFKEFPLGNEMIADYLIIGKSSSGYHFVFVELESVYDRITLHNGSFGASIRKGISQVKDWKRWLPVQFNQFYQELNSAKKDEDSLSDEFITYDPTRFHFVVVAGRRDDFNDFTYRLSREEELKENIKVIHYDNLIDYSNRMIYEMTY